MNSMLLARQENINGKIDLSIGEPEIITKNLKSLISLDFDVNSCNWTYCNPSGLDKLKSLLEDTYQSPIIITNGAKQALSAIFYVFSLNGLSNLITRNPYWTLLKPLAKYYNCNFININDLFPPRIKNSFYLLTAPNNPDGFIPQESDIILLESILSDFKIPLVHDAVYYTDSFCNNINYINIGDLQVGSFSKMFGMPSLRLGYIVCKNTNYYNDLVEYIETTTVGVSEVSQRIAYDVLNYFKCNPILYSTFCQMNKNKILENRSKILELDKNLEAPLNYFNQYGMFAWLKKSNEYNEETCKIKGVDGKFFGDENYIRFNIGVLPEKLCQ